MNVLLETDSVILNHNEADPKKYIFVEKECNVSLFVIFLFEAETTKNILRNNFARIYFCR